MLRHLKSVFAALAAIMCVSANVEARISIDLNDGRLTIFGDDVRNDIEFIETGGRIFVVVSRFDDVFEGPFRVRSEDFDATQVGHVEVTVEGDETNVLFKCSQTVNVFFGDGDNDVVAFGSRRVYVRGGIGNRDEITTHNCSGVTISLGAGGPSDNDDVEIYGAESASVIGGDGDDYVICGHPPEGLRSLSGIIAGFEATSTVPSDRFGSYEIYGGGGGDELVAIDDRPGSTAEYLLSSGEGDDFVYGAQYAVNDLRGGAGRDYLVGGFRADVLRGDAGDDVLIGCRPAGQSGAYDRSILRTPTPDGKVDDMVGGLGADTFYDRFAVERTQTYTTKQTRWYYDWKTNRFIQKLVPVVVTRTYLKTMELERVGDFQTSEGDVRRTTVVDD